MLPTIDFRAIRAHDGSKHRAFEELCYQLVPVIDSLPIGVSLVRHGTPDGGVEMRATLPGGEVWAWQAKYLFTLDDGAFGQLDRSVAEALDAHPDLTRYTFCLPYERPAANVPRRKSAMQRWEEHCRKWSSWASDRGMAVEFAYLGESALLGALMLPGQAGHAYYWFNATVLTPQWFAETVDRAIAGAGERYTPEIHVALPVAAAFDGLGRTPTFQARLRAALREIRDRRTFGGRGLPTGPGDDPAIRASLSECERLLDDVDRQVMAAELADTAPIPFDAIAVACREAAALLWDASTVMRAKGRGRDVGPVGSVGGRPDGYAWQEAAWQLERVATAVVALATLAEGEAAALVNVGALLLTGEPGSGKTHLLCDVAQARCRVGWPTIVLLGQCFTRDEPWVQILRELDLDCTAEQFLAALNVAAETTNARALIMIDALNEGDGPDLWPDRLGQFLQKVRRWPRIGVAFSCRTSYVDVTVPAGLDASRLVRVEHEGFAGHEYDAAKTFFAHYGLRLPDFPLLLPEYRNPLFLKLMCRGLSVRGAMTMVRGTTGITTLFAGFLDAVDKRLATRDRCDYAPSQRLAREAVGIMAAEMVARNSQSVPLDVARDLVDALLPDRPWSRSLFNGLLTEGVLMRERMYRRDGEEVVLFAYQRLGDHSQARIMCEQNDADTIAHVCARLATMGRRASGLLEALAIQLPERFGRELHEFVPDDRLDVIAEAFLTSLIWRHPHAFPATWPRDYLARIMSSRAGLERLFEVLLQVACVPEHPLNARYLHDLLWPRSMAERDSRWSTFLHRAYTYTANSTVARLLDWAWSATPAGCADDALLLWATTVAWYLTSSNRYVRDRATKALVHLLHGRFDVLLALLDRFDGVNDPYVAERLHAVVYGCCLISDDHGAIGRIADKTYARVFAGATPPAHILLRDYARGVVERALSLGCSLPHIDMNKVRPPYTSPWPLRAPTAETLAARYGGEDYSDLRMSLFPDAIGDFNRYVIEPSVLDFLAPNQRKRAAVARRQAESAALDAWRQFVDALAEDQRRRLEEKDWEGFFDSLSEAQRGCLNDARSAERERRTPREVRFDSQLVARWVFARVMDLGWRPERFAEFDHSIAASNSRTDHGAERIGKKYQWIALHEALARVADHCVYKPLWSSEASHASHAYEGPWQLGRRDIDPSLLPAPRPRADHAEASPQAWWVQASAQFPQPCADNARRAWVLEQSDLPDPSRLIDVTDPTKHRWLAVEGFYEWEEDVPVEVPRSSADRCVLWCRVSGYIVRRADLSPLLRWLGERKSTEWCMPENTSLSRVFLGEHGWHPSSREVDQGWVTPYTAPDAPAPVLIPSASYSWESGGYDRSLEKTVTAYVPSLPLLSSLRLQWQGEDFRYGHHRRAPALACDPGVSGEGPRALLVDRQALCEWLERERLALLWTVKAEKQVRTERTPVVHAMYGTYLLDGDRIRRAAFTTELFGLSQGVGSGRRE